MIFERGIAVIGAEAVEHEADRADLDHRRAAVGAAFVVTGLSANTIVRLKQAWSQEYDEWMQRDLSGKHYVYVWADGIYAKVRLEDDANQKQCLLVLMGATADGHKELITVIDGYRESKQSWRELLLDLKHRGLSLAPKLAVACAPTSDWRASVKSPVETPLPGSVRF